MHELRARHATATTPVVVSGCVGPRGDGYDPGQVMSSGAAQAYHAHQIDAFAAAGADMITAITMTNTNESIGVARAAGAVERPVAISFTLETDGRLPTGQAQVRINYLTSAKGYKCIIWRNERCDSAVDGDEEKGLSQRSYTPLNCV
jgi:S-methylmethionine-dependent homocysteine/selenocysteine methylase